MPKIEKKSKKEALYQ